MLLTISSKIFIITQQKSCKRTAKRNDSLHNLLPHIHYLIVMILFSIHSLFEFCHKSCQTFWLIFAKNLFMHHSNEILSKLEELRLISFAWCNTESKIMFIVCKLKMYHWKDIKMYLLYRRFCVSDCSRFEYKLLLFEISFTRLK